MIQRMEDTIDIRDYLRVILKYRWLIISFFIVSVSLSAFFSFKMMPIYSAVTTLSIESESPNVLNFKDVITLGQSNQDYYMTQCKIIRSRNIAEITYNKLNLWERHKNLYTKTLAKNRLRLPADIIEGQVREKDFLKFMKAIDVKSIRTTRLVEISTESKDPQEAAKIANTIAEVYQEENLKMKLDTTEDAGNWLVKQIKDQRKKSHEAEFALQKYIEESGIISISTLNEENSAEIGNKLISNLKEKLAFLEAEQVTLTSRYKEKHPKMIRLMAEIQAIRKKLEDEINSNYRLNQKSIKYNILKREVEVNQKMYDSLLNRAKETNIAVDLKTNNIRIIDPARVPEKPVRPKPLLNIVLAMLISLSGAIGLSFFLENMDDTIKGSDEIKQYTKMQILGTVPALNDKEYKGLKELISYEDPKGVISESFKTIRTAVNFSLFEKQQKAILITSSGPGEGKTFSTTNMGIALAQTDQKILLIDADMRKPRMHQLFNLPNENGLSRLLIKDAELNDAVLQTTIPNLCVLPSGPVPPNPAELLGSSGMRQIIEKLKYSFDLILVDSPPVMFVTDPVIISSIVEGVILVVQNNKTKVKHLITAKCRLEEAHSDIIGVINNKIDITGGDYYYYPYYKYYRQPKSEEKITTQI